MSYDAAFCDSGPDKTAINLPRIVQVLIGPRKPIVSLSPWLYISLEYNDRYPENSSVIVEDTGMALAEVEKIIVDSLMPQVSTP